MGARRVLFHAATGSPPFRGPTAIALLHAVLTQAPPRPRDLAPGVSPALDALVVRCLQKDPAARPSAAEVARALGGEAAPPGRAHLVGASLVCLVLVLGLGVALRAAPAPTPSATPASGPTTGAAPDPAALVTEARGALDAGRPAEALAALERLGEPLSREAADLAADALLLHAPGDVPAIWSSRAVADDEAGRWLIGCHALATGESRGGPMELIRLARLEREARDERDADELPERLADLVGHVAALPPAAPRRVASRLAERAQRIVVARAPDLVPLAPGTPASLSSLLARARGLRPGPGAVAIAALEHWTAARTEAAKTEKEITVWKVRLDVTRPGCELGPGWERARLVAMSLTAWSGECTSEAFEARRRWSPELDRLALADPAFAIDSPSSPLRELVLAGVEICSWAPLELLWIERRDDATWRRDVVEACRPPRLFERFALVGRVRSHGWKLAVTAHLLTGDAPKAKAILDAVPDKDLTIWRLYAAELALLRGEAVQLRESDGNAGEQAAYRALAAALGQRTDAQAEAELRDAARTLQTSQIHWRRPLDTLEQLRAIGRGWRPETKRRLWVTPEESGE